jgi:hypothetical protein
MKVCEFELAGDEGISHSETPIACDSESHESRVSTRRAIQSTVMNLDKTYVGSALMEGIDGNKFTGSRSAAFDLLK